MAYWEECHIVKDEIQYKRPLIIDYPTTTYYIPSSPSQPKIAEQLITKKELKLDTNGHLIIQEPHIYIEIIFTIKSNLEKIDYSVIAEILPLWSPYGASRFLELVVEDYFSNMVIFRAIKVSYIIYYILLYY